MPRKQDEPTGASDLAPVERVACIDGAPAPLESDGPKPLEREKKWTRQYKAIVICNEKGFEMGENRHFRQRIFKFVEKPDRAIVDQLKAAGFTYRGAEKVWTIEATPANRALSDDLAHKFAGDGPAYGR